MKHSEIIDKVYKRHRIDFKKPIFTIATVNEMISDALDECLDNAELVEKRDYEEVIQSHRENTREIDIILNGKNAAKQASLCDLIDQIKTLKKESEEPSQPLDELDEDIEQADFVLRQFEDWMHGDDGFKASVARKALARLYSKLHTSPP